ncbi:WhiB family transcriptional regulator [Streptomyces sp. NPDC007903]|uniref:WhiB family transcriptional regulator n=1 Tax=Streptomyces sp. NPDC007903 TaxID=3364786 RepID=UPI0036EDB2C3
MPRTSAGTAALWSAVPQPLRLAARGHGEVRHDLFVQWTPGGFRLARSSIVRRRRSRPLLSLRPGGSRDRGPLARAICRRCPVIIACRTWALDHGEDDGIWGATTAAQRRAIRRAMTEPIPVVRRRGDGLGKESLPE